MGTIAEFHLIIINGHTPLLAPEPLHDRVREGTGRYRVQILAAPGDPDFYDQIAEAYQRLQLATSKRPTVLSLDHDSWRPFSQYTIALSGLGLHFEHRPEGDLPGIRWVEVPDARPDDERLKATQARVVPMQQQLDDIQGYVEEIHSWMKPGTPEERY